MKRFVTVIAVLFMLASSAFALSDSEYKEMMKDSDFAGAEKKLARIWDEAKAKLSPEHFAWLQEEQKEWLTNSRDHYAGIAMSGRTPPAKAYADATEQRINDIQGAIWAAEITPDDADENIFPSPAGYEIDISLDRKTGILKASFESDEAKTVWTAGGKLSGNVLTVSDDKGSAEIMYLDLNTVTVKSDAKLRGNGVNVDGKYQQFLNGAQIRNQKKSR